MGYLLLHIFFAIVSHHVAIVDSCSCAQPDPYEGICESDFAINATVLTKDITYPDNNSDLYDVRYELNIHNVFTPNGADADSVPNILNSYGPGSMCGLTLKVDATYILTGSIIDDTNTGNKVLDMYLCDLHQYVTGYEFWDSKFEEAEELVNSVDCSYSTDNSNFGKLRSSGKHDQKARGPAVQVARTKGKAEKFRAFLSQINQRGLKRGIESFFSLKAHKRQG